MKRSLAWMFSGCLVVWSVAVVSIARAYVCPGSTTNYVTDCTNMGGAACIRTTAGSGCCAPGTCRQGVCDVPGTQTACNDANQCTTDSCGTLGGTDALHQWDPVCSYTMISSGTACNRDADLCTLDTCQNGVCLYSGSTVTCTGLQTSQCQQPACNPATGNCFAQNKADGTPCDDGKDCTYAEVCNNGVCAGGPGAGLKRPTGYRCTDGNVCNPGTCNGTDGTCHNRSAALDGTTCELDGNKCTIDTCITGNCVQTSTVVCNIPHDPQCQQVGCRSSDGTCFTTNDSNGTKCDDGKDCSYGDVCQQGACTGVNLRAAGTPCWDVQQWCFPGTCNGTNSTCSNRANLPLGSNCDFNSCTNATCQMVGGQETCVINGCLAATCSSCGGGTCGTIFTGTTAPCQCTDVFPLSPPN